jgi:hypothetical protein
MATFPWPVGGRLTTVTVNGGAGRGIRGRGVGAGSRVRVGFLGVAVTVGRGAGGVAVDGGGGTDVGVLVLGTADELDGAAIGGSVLVGGESESRTEAARPLPAPRGHQSGQDCADGRRAAGKPKARKGSSAEPDHANPDDRQSGRDEHPPTEEGLPERQFTDARLRSFLPLKLSDTPWTQATQLSSTDLPRRVPVARAQCGMIGRSGEAGCTHGSGPWWCASGEDSGPLLQHTSGRARRCLWRREGVVLREDLVQTGLSAVRTRE